MTLLELAERCEKATGPDRELDAAIIVACQHDLPAPMGECSASLRLPHKDDRCEAGTYWLVQRSGMSLRTARSVTASLDAAMTLVPEGMILRQYRASRFVKHECEVGIDYAHGGWGGHSDYSFALALTAAALKARAQEADRG